MKYTVKTRIKFQKHYYNAGDIVEMTSQEALMCASFVEILDNQLKNTAHSLSEMTVAQLKQLAKEYGIDVSTCKLKSDYLHAIEATLSSGSEIIDPLEEEEDSDYLDV